MPDIGSNPIPDERAKAIEPVIRTRVTIPQMMEPVEIDDIEIKTVEKPWALTGTGMARSHNIVNSLYLKPDLLEQKNFERYETYAPREKSEVMYEEYMMDDADICLVAFGITARVAKSAIAEARAKGIKVGLLRPITLWPFPSQALAARASQCKAFISVEMNMGQMIDDVKLAISCSTV